jgi:hypothetical protein
VWILEGKRPLGRCKNRWEDDIQIDVQELVGEGVDWIFLAQHSELCLAPQSVGLLWTSDQPVAETST